MDDDEEPTHRMTDLQRLSCVSMMIALKDPKGNLSGKSKKNYVSGSVFTEPLLPFVGEVPQFENFWHNCRVRICFAEKIFWPAQKTRRLRNSSDCEGNSPVVSSEYIFLAFVVHAGFVFGSGGCWFLWAFWFVVGTIRSYRL